MIGNAEEISEITCRRVRARQGSGDGRTVAVDDDPVQGVVGGPWKKVGQERGSLPRASCHA